MQPHRRFSFGSISRRLTSYFWLLIVVGMLLTIGLGYLPLDAQTTDISETVSRCIPQQTRQPIVRSELIGSSRLQGKNYYLLAIYTENNQQPTNLIIAVTNGRCEELFFNPMGDRIPFASAVPRSVAQQLTLAQYRREIQRIGKDRFQQQVIQVATTTQNPTWFAEEVWALRQLDITVPTNVQVQQ
ncbi:MAG: hypothetical protein HC840_02040 [Leptolyngbyaceae cyanobacterium RM2_2_4]|nr:hypothetical protein [Leptolyngbyaceae cyanobacterium RM2_2_4]